MKSIEKREISHDEMIEFAGALAEIAHNNEMTIASCAEPIDLRQCGIEHNSCIDQTLIEEIIGCKIRAQKDKNQRSECGCIESVEVGTYNICRNGCKYCYANHSQESVLKNCEKYNSESPLLCGVITEEDKITVRKVKSLKIEQ